MEIKSVNFFVADTCVLATEKLKLKGETFMNNITIKKYINSAIAIIVMIGFGYLPVLDPITPLGMKILGIFLGCIYGWLTVDVFWPSILGLVLLGHTGYMPVSQVFASAFSNTTLLLMLFMMMLGGLISASGVADVLTLKLLSTRGLQGKPWIIAFVLFVASFLISALCGGAVASPRPPPRGGGG